MSDTSNVGAGASEAAVYQAMAASFPSSVQTTQQLEGTQKAQLSASESSIVSAIASETYDKLTTAMNVPKLQQPNVMGAWAESLRQILEQVIAENKEKMPLIEQMVAETDGIKTGSANLAPQGAPQAAATQIEQSKEVVGSSQMVMQAAVGGTSMDKIGEIASGLTKALLQSRSFIDSDVYQNIMRFSNQAV